MVKRGDMVLVRNGGVISSAVVTAVHSDDSINVTAFNDGFSTPQCYSSVARHAPGVAGVTFVERDHPVLVSGDSSNEAEAFKDN